MTTKSDAVYTLYKVINSNIISDELEWELRDIALCIEGNEWEDEESFEEEKE